MSQAATRWGPTIRERVPPLPSIPLPAAVDRRLLDRRWPVSELAPRPPGSGLRPVPGNAGAPFIGHTVELIRYGPEFRERWERQFGPVSWSGAFGRRIVLLSGPDAVQVALVNRDKAFSQRGWDYFIGRFFGRGLMLLDFGEHHLHRRIMQEAFTRDRVEGYVRQMGPVLRAGIGEWPDGTELRLFRAVKRVTLNVATRVFMGLQPGDEQERVNRAFIAAVRAGTAFVRAPVPGGRWSAGLRGRRVLEQYFAERLAATRGRDGSDLLSALGQATTPDGRRFTDADLVNHMIFLMMAAHDTSTIATTAAAYYLAKYPQWQVRARRETLELGDAVPDADALDRLATLDLVIKESLRLVPPVPSLVRETVIDTEVLGYYVPARSLVSLSLSSCHFAPEYWSDPHTFDPERFGGDRREDRGHRYAWMPFGGGAHKCIGLHFGTLEVKALLHEMLRTYLWSVPDDYTARWDYTSLPVPIDGLPVRLVRR